MKQIEHKLAREADERALTNQHHEDTWTWGHVERPGEDESRRTDSLTAQLVPPGPLDIWTIGADEDPRDYMGMDSPIAENCDHPHEHFERRYAHGEWTLWKYRGGTDTPRPATPAETERIK